ncbi:MAG: porin family protein [Acidobacteriota bacterium]|nr:porin family protein [Acidobacteriota bacterium]
MHRLPAPFLFASAVFAQHLSYGVIGGAPVTDLVSNQTGSRYTIGPTIQLLLPFGIGIEADALYRPLDFRTTNPFGVFSASGSQWRFPILLQYRLGTPLIKPFVEAGASFDHISGISQAVSSVHSPGDLLQNSSAGLILGAGLDLKAPFVRLTPGLRYTRQSSASFRDISNQNQFEFLVGLRF